MLRCLAFLMVWLAHSLLSFTGLLPQTLLNLVEGAGSCGVPVFFFLSAFLITERFRLEQEATGTVHLPGFYMRRILRIWPLYFGALALYALLGLRFHGFRIEPGRLLASCLLAGNWYIVFHPWIKTPMRALWSVSVEEQWYVLVPLLTRALSPQRLLVCCGVTIVAALCLLAGLASLSQPAMLHITAWTNSGVQFQYFAMGAGTALLLQGRVPRLRAGLRLLLLCGALAAVCFTSGICHIKDPRATHTAASLIAGYLLAGVGAGALFFSLFGMRPSRCPRVLVRLGRLSFGLYVFHETGFFLANALARHAALHSTLLELALEKLLALVFTIGLAFASYYAWERPFLRLKQRWTFLGKRAAL